MLQNVVKFAVATVGVAIICGYAAANLLGDPSAPAAMATGAHVATASVATSNAPAQAELASGREFTIPVGPRGQFFTDVDVNHHPVHMLVDTGATDVALSASTARAMNLNFGETVNVVTAGGVAKATRIHLDNVELGGIRLVNVDALALPPEAGEVNLLGMSFLGRLASAEKTPHGLVLRQ